MKKNTRKLKKAALLLCSAVLLVCISIGATVAYLTSQDTVTNTFTVGNVQITLDEAKVTPDGKPVDPAERTDANSYKLLPGHTYTKDPMIHVDAASENCWLFVKVENGIAAIEDANKTIAAQMTANGWTLVENTTNIYKYKETVSGGANIPVFGEFAISNAVIGGMKPITTDGAGDDGKLYLDEYKNAKIVITAYAIQADGFSTAEAAWTTAGSSFTA